jgi:large subunit ribosomal protein L17
MFRNMVTSLIKHDRITTTDAKAKELRGIADHLITLAKRGDLHARRQALAIVRETEVVHKLFETVNARFGAIAGGYTRIVKVGYRPGDAAKISIIELITPDAGSKKKPAKKKKAAKKAGLSEPTPVTESKETASATAATVDAATEAVLDDTLEASAPSVDGTPEPAAAAPAQGDELLEATGDVKSSDDTATK